MGRPWKVSVAESSPGLAAQADGWDPTTVGEGSNKPYPWRCQECGHRWPRSPVARKRNPQCPGCENRALVVGFNDVATRLQHLLPEVHGWDPTQVRFNETTRVDWKCPKSTCAQVYDMSANKRWNGQNCPYCAGKRIAVGVNDLGTTHPALAAEADGWDPTTVTAGSSKIKPWKCTEPRCQYRWSVSVDNRALQGTRCPACANKVVVAGYNDIATTHPDIAAQAMGQWKPSEYTYGSDFMGRWQCPEPECLRQWNDSISHRTIEGRGCPDCSLLKNDGSNSLLRVDPYLAEEAWGWNPRFVSAKARMRLHWRCRKPDCRYIWRADVAARAYGSGCPQCSEYGFRVSKPGCVYLLTKQIGDRTALKVGITNDLVTRLATHARYGWVVVESTTALAGIAVKRHEVEVLTMLDSKQVPRGFSAFGVAFPGYTESWWEDDLPVSSLDGLLDAAHETCMNEERIIARTREQRVNAPQGGPLVRRMRPADVPTFPTADRTTVTPTTMKEPA